MAINEEAFYHWCLLAWGWPEPHVNTVYDHTYGDFPAENAIYVVLWPTLHV